MKKFISLTLTCILFLGSPCSAYATEIVPAVQDESVTDVARENFPEDMSVPDAAEYDSSVPVDESVSDMSEEDVSLPDVSVDESAEELSSGDESAEQEDMFIIHEEPEVSEEYENEYGLMEEDHYEDMNEDGTVTVHGFEIKDTDEELVGAGLPPRYIPDKNTGISDQGNSQSCWAYAAMTCAERSLLEAGVADSLNLSEMHMLYGYYNRDGDSGIPVGGRAWNTTNGSFYMPIAAMAELIGAADENRYPSDIAFMDSRAYTDDIAHLEEATILPNYPSASSSWKQNEWNSVTNGIKDAVLNNGAVWVSVRSTGNASETEWYTEWPYTETSGTRTYKAKPSADHAVVIIGWDDEMQIDGAENTGAWYVQNSWGEWGNDGYFWISYDDASLNNPVALCMEKSPLGQMQDTEVYSHTGTGYSGASIKGSTSNYGVNVFFPSRNVLIDHAGFYTNARTDYRVEIITGITDMSDPESGTVVSVAEGTVSGAGFHKVKLDNNVTIGKGETFAVKTVCIDSQGKYQTLFEGKTTNLRNIECDEGESFLYVNGTAYDCATCGNAKGIDLAGKYHSPCIYAYGVPIDKVLLTGGVKTIRKGRSFSMKAYAVSGKKKYSITPKWTTSSSLSVSKAGKVTVKGTAVTGNATITASCAGLRASHSVFVEVPADVEGCLTMSTENDFLCPNESDMSFSEDSKKALYLFQKEDGYSRIRHIYSDTYLSPQDTKPCFLRYEDASAQLWEILKVSNGYVLRNKETGKYISDTSFADDIKNAVTWILNEAYLDIQDAVLTMPTSAAWTGSAVQVPISLHYGAYEIEADIKYSSNTDPGSASALITGKGITKGTRTEHFTIVKSAQKIDSGNYWIIPVNAPGRALTVEKGKMTAKTKIYLSNQGNSEAQKFIFSKNADGTYTITDQKSDFVAGIRNNSTASCALLETQLDTGSPFQRWNIKKHEDGSYSIINSKTGKALYLVGGKTSAGTNIAQSIYTNNIIQCFYLVKTNAEPHKYSGIYTLRPAKKTSLALEIAGASLAGGANARLGKYGNANAQRFRLMYSGNGYYRIMNIHSGKVLGIKDNSAKNGMNVRQAEWAASAGQRWKIVEEPDGSLLLKSAAGTALDIYSANIRENTNVDSWAVNHTAAQKWKLVSG